MPFRVARSQNLMLISLLVAVPLGMALVWSRSGFMRASDASLNFVGHLISEFQDRSLSPLMPTYPLYF